MKVPCQNLTISRVTIREIGTKLLKRKLVRRFKNETYVKMRIQVPVVLRKTSPQFELHLLFLSNPRYGTFSRLLIIQVVPMADPITLRMI